MRRLSILALILMMSAWVIASKDSTLDDLKARAETASPSDRISICVEVAERELKIADEAFTAGKVDEAQAAVKDIVTYAGKAHDAALESGKKIKGTEIAFRKMAAKLKDIKRTLSFEDQAPVEAAADQLEKLRTDLLGKMFGKGK